MIEIGPHIVAAFERDGLADRVGDFAGWWVANDTLLGATPPPAVLRALLDRGDELARSLGIQPDDPPQRYYLCALFQAWMPNPNARQYLLATDVIFDFDDRPASESITAMAQLARESR
jgi:hypothetical protein